MKGESCATHEVGNSKPWVRNLDHTYILVNEYYMSTEVICWDLVYDITHFCYKCARLLAFEQLEYFIEMSKKTDYFSLLDLAYKEKS